MHDAVSRCDMHARLRMRMQMRVRVGACRRASSCVELWVPYAEEGGLLNSRATVHTLALGKAQVVETAKLVVCFSPATGFALSSGRWLALVALFSREVREHAWGPGLGRACMGAGSMLGANG